MSAMHAPLPTSEYRSFCAGSTCTHVDKCLDPAPPLLPVFLNARGCRSVTACCVCMHACAPLRVSKNEEEEEEERWERRVKCVCVCGGGGGGVRV